MEFAILVVGLGAVLFMNHANSDRYPSPDDSQTARRTSLHGINLTLHQNSEFMFGGQRDSLQLDWYKKPRSFGEVVDKYNDKQNDKHQLIKNLFRRRNVTIGAPTTNLHFTRPQVIVPFFDKMKHSEYRPPKIDHRM